MFRKTLILDRNGSIDHILRNLVNADPDAVFRSIELLQLFCLSGCRIGVVDDGGLCKRNVAQLQCVGIFVGFRDDILLEIVGEFRHEYRTCDCNDQRECCADHHDPQENLTDYLQDHADNSPCSARLFCRCLCIFFHRMEPRFQNIFCRNGR